MPVPTINTFTSYSLSPEEVLSGSVLNSQQKQVLQNELAQVAEQILSLTYNPLNPQEFVQNDSFLKGQMSVLRVILLRSEESELQLRNPEGN